MIQYEMKRIVVKASDNKGKVFTPIYTITLLFQHLIINNNPDEWY